MDLLTNARILTLNEQHPEADWLLIDRGTIVAVGNRAEFKNLPDKIDNEYNLAGATITPGFTDSHLHLLQYAQSLTRIDCDTPTRQACLETIAEAALHRESNEWIHGHGWNNHQWEQNEVTKELLDQVVPHHPVYLTNKSLHGAWVNSKALQACGIDKNTSDPVGGRIGRDTDGNPTGLLYESAMRLVADNLPEITEQEAIQQIENAQENLFQHGITTVHDFDRLTAFTALQTLDFQRRLKLRVIKSLPIDSLQEVIKIQLRSGFGSSRLTFRGIKLFLDGALGTKTAAMLEPYENTSETGMLLMSENDLWSIAQNASLNQLQLAIHAIGDLANRVVINIFQKLRKWELDHRRQGLMHRIEHLQTCQLEDIQKLHGLNVAASVQPIHLASDIPAAEKWLGKRTRDTYAFNSLFKARIPVIFGSDAPVEQPDCLLGIHTAIHRTQRNNLPSSGWQPGEKITPLQALTAFTRNPHEYFPLSHVKLGKLSPGYAADLIVLNDFPLEPREMSYKDLEIQKTMINGEWVWEG